jgi:hypothetical protein
MFNRICQVVIAVGMIALILFGVYKIIPEKHRNSLRQVFQEATDKDAKDMIKLFSDVDVKNHEGITYEEIFDSNGSNASWYVEKVDEATGKYKLHANTYNATIDMEKWDQGKGNKTYIRSHVELIFDVTYTSELAAIDKLTLYIDDELMDDYYKQLTLDIMCKGVN